MVGRTRECEEERPGPRRTGTRGPQELVAIHGLYTDALAACLRWRAVFQHDRNYRVICWCCRLIRSKS